MIIFGWGHRTSKNYGPVFKYSCKNCNNEAFWNLHKVSSWFTLFFIPIFPYRTERLLMCPVCGNAGILDNQRFEEMRVIAEVNQSFADGKINKEEYGLKMDQIEAEQSKNKSQS